MWNSTRMKWQTGQAPGAAAPSKLQRTHPNASWPTPATPRNWWRSHRPPPLCITTTALPQKDCLKFYLSWRGRWPSDRSTRRSPRGGPSASPLVPGRFWCGPWRRRLGRPPSETRVVPRQLIEARRGEASSTETRLERTVRTRLVSTTRLGLSLGVRERMGYFLPILRRRRVAWRLIRIYYLFPWRWLAEHTGRILRWGKVPLVGAERCMRRGRGGCWGLRTGRRWLARTGRAGLSPLAALAVLDLFVQLQQWEKIAVSRELKV